MEKGQYFASGSPADLEDERLSLLESLFDPETIRRMESLGIGSGWCCLEVGAGHGSIVRWLAARVGPSGRVVAADIDLRFLERIDLSNVESRHHDLREADFEPRAYDLVHCRAVLMHLPNPEEAFARMVLAVRPGGWLLVQEGDYGSFGSVDSSYPGASEFDRFTRSALDAVQAHGFGQPYFGRRLPGMVERIGFENFGGEGIVYFGRGGNHPLARFHSLSARVPQSAELLIRLGVRTREQNDHVLRMYDDPSFEFVGPTLVSAWARRP